MIELLPGIGCITALFDALLLGCCTKKEEVQKLKETRILPHPLSREESHRSMQRHFEKCLRQHQTTETSLTTPSPQESMLRAIRSPTPILPLSFTCQSMHLEGSQPAAPETHLGFSTEYQEGWLVGTCKTAQGKNTCNQIAGRVLRLFSHLLKEHDNNVLTTCNNLVEHLHKSFGSSIDQIASKKPPFEVTLCFISQNDRLVYTLTMGNMEAYLFKPNLTGFSICPLSQISTPLHRRPAFSYSHHVTETEISPNDFLFLSSSQIYADITPLTIATLLRHPKNFKEELKTRIQQNEKLSLAPIFALLTHVKQIKPAPKKEEQKTPPLDPVAE